MDSCAFGNRDKSVIGSSAIELERLALDAVLLDRLVALTNDGSTVLIDSKVAFSQVLLLGRCGTSGSVKAFASRIISEAYRRKIVSFSITTGYQVIGILPFQRFRRQQPAYAPPV